MRTETLLRGAILAGAAFFVVVGAWALGAPASFYHHVASFPPYNRHFLHDVGAFQLGLGAALLLALTAWSGRLVALWAVTVASVLHAVSHVLDRDLGGRGSDPVLLSLAAAAFLLVAVLGTRKEVRRDSPAPPPVGLRPPASPREPQPD
jgi:hypothetical protein